MSSSGLSRGPRVRRVRRRRREFAAAACATIGTPLAARWVLGTKPEDDTCRGVSRHGVCRATQNVRVALVVVGLRGNWLRALPATAVARQPNLRSAYAQPPVITAFSYQKCHPRACPEDPGCDGRGAAAGVPGGSVRHFRRDHCGPLSSSGQSPKTQRGRWLYLSISPNRSLQVNYVTGFPLRTYPRRSHL
jgi:hypothetical protein